MEKYIAQLNKIISENNSIKQTQVAVYTDDMYLIHILGYQEHSFSIKIARFPEDIICFFGYNIEMILPLSDDSFNEIVQKAMDAIKFGTRLVELRDERVVGIYEFISYQEVSIASITRFYKEDRIANGKSIIPCKLSCSNFRGSNVFEIDIL